MVTGPGRTNSPPSSEGSRYNPSVSSLDCLAESEGHLCWWRAELMSHGQSPWSPTVLLPRFRYGYINIEGWRRGDMLKWETEKFFVPSPYRAAAGTPYLLTPPSS